MEPTTQRYSASQLVRDIGVSLDDFAAQIDDLIISLPESEASLPAKERHREVCAAILAAVTAAQKASKLSDDDRGQLSPRLPQLLLPYWRRHCAQHSQLLEHLAAKLPSYLSTRSPASQFETANFIVNQLLNAIGAESSVRARLAKELVPIFAYKILGDITHIDSIKGRFSLQFSVIAATLATVELCALAAPHLRFA